MDTIASRLLPHKWSAGKYCNSCWKSPWFIQKTCTMKKHHGFQVPLHVLCNKFGDLALFISITRDSSNDSFFALRDTDTAYSWGGRAGSQVWYSPHHLRTTSASLELHHDVSLQHSKKTRKQQLHENSYTGRKKTTYKGKCMIHGVQTYNKSVLMCMQFMAK